MKPLVYLLNRLIDQTHRALTSWMCYERHHCIFVLYQLHPEPCADHWCFDLIPVRSADTLGDSCCFEDEVIAVLDTQNVPTVALVQTAEFLSLNEVHEREIGLHLPAFAAHITLKRSVLVWVEDWRCFKIHH
ncbi:hypothetical protein A9C11_33565 (plasmid) [Pseudomonas citronellolis]|uniref:Uncharacterized protein n=1 Tax=Pseudomonas citronellolis TaxID=53408 RepID=A0A1A9KPS3_9PSED|nr:hypothetical protein A9C11_33565 [Pseudomonas citronellolis]KWR86556.1 hypothetical protein RN02_00850 [Pseudomonas sp. PI1]